MNRLYKTYLLLRKGSRQALKEYFEALIESSSKVNVNFDLHETQHIEFIVNSNLNFNTSFASGSAFPFGAKVNSNLDANANILIYEPYFFNSLVTIDNCVDIDFNIENYLASLIESSIDFGNVINFTSGLHTQTLSDIIFDFIIEDMLESNLYLTSYVADKFKTQISIGDFYSETHLDTNYSDNLVADITVDDVLIPSAYFLTYEPYTFTYEIDSNFDTIDEYNLSDAVADIFKYDVDIADEIDYNAMITNATSKIFSLDSYLDLNFKFIAEVTVHSNPVIPFRYLIPITSWLETSMTTYESDLFGYISSDNLNIEVSFTSLDISTFGFDLEQSSHLETEITNYTGDIFGSDLSDNILKQNEYTFNLYDSVSYGVSIYNFIITDSFTAAMFVKSDATLLRCNIINTIVKDDFDSHVVSCTAVDFGCNNINTIIKDEFLAETYAYTSISSDFSIINMIIAEEFDAEVVNSTANDFEVDIVLDSSIIKDFDSNVQSYESLSLSSLCDNYLDISMNAFMELAGGIADFFEAYVPISIDNNLNVSSLIDWTAFEYNFKFDTIFDISAHSELSQYEMFDFRYALDFDDIIISDFHVGNIVNYPPTYLGGTNYSVDFEIDMYANVDVIEVPAELFSAFVPVDFELDVTTQVGFRDADIMKTKIVIDDIFNVRSKLVPLDVISTYTDIIFNDLTYDVNASFTLLQENRFKTVITNTGTSKMESHFIYSTFAKLNEYNDLSYTLGSMSSSTLDELSYHTYSY